MKPIKYTKPFQKRFKQRVASQPNLLRRFEDRIELFQQGVHGKPLNDHSLRGKMSGFRSFSIAGDTRVVYYEETDCFRFVDVGTHNQVYK